MRSLIFWGFLGLACNGGESPTDAGGADSGQPDALNRDSGSTDSGGVDGGLVDSGENPGVITAVLDARCTYQDRVGVVAVSEHEGAGRYLDLVWYDKPTPWFGPPVLSDAACRFHQSAWDGTCRCADQEVCDYQNRCVEAPLPLKNIQVVVQGNADSQTLTGDGDGTLSDQLTVVGATLGLQVTVDNLEIRVAPLAVPPVLTAVMGTLAGTLEAPEGVSLRWDGVAGAQVYTHININHHVREPTFTECSVAGEVGQLQISGDMLVPLAVVTGLEFQGLEHIRFAAAQLPAGCLEFRFLRRTFVSL